MSLKENQFASLDTSNLRPKSLLHNRKGQRNLLLWRGFIYVSHLELRFSIRSERILSRNWKRDAEDKWEINLFRTWSSWKLKSFVWRKQLKSSKFIAGTGIRRIWKFLFDLFYGLSRNRDLEESWIFNDFWCRRE